MIRTTMFAALLLGATAAAASPRDDVLAAVASVLQAVNTQDAALLETVMLPQAIIVAQRYDATDGKLVTRVLTVAEMAERFRTQGRRVDERIQNPTVLIQRDLAHVWSRYTIDSDGKRLHCGVDSFGLARVDGALRLTSLTWTAEPQGCPK